MSENLPQTVYNNILSINSLTANVSLGITPEERSIPQQVVIDLRFYIPESLSSSIDDNGEYFCYHNLSEKIYALCTSKEYRLIEFLIMEVYRMVRKQVPDSVKIWIKLHKTSILLDYVQNGASFTYSDLPPNSWTIPA
ncbi:MAG: dihydroneopterin aldolase [Pseudomonadota bacterium]